MAAKVASLLIDIQADIASIRKDMDQASAVVTKFGENVSRVGKAVVAAFSARAVIAFGESITRQIDAMADAAENLKFPVDDFAAIQGAALLAGQSIDTTTAALGKFNVAMGKASEGDKATIERLNELGVKILDANGKMRSQVDILQELSKAITGIEDPFKRTANEVAFFGKSGQSMSAILVQLSKNSAELSRELQAMGLIHTPAATKAMADNADAMDKSKRRAEVLFGVLYAAGASQVWEAIALGLGRINAGLTLMEGFATRDKIGAFFRGVFGAQGATAQLAERSQEYGRVVDNLDKAEKELAGLEQRRLQSNHPQASFYQTRREELQKEITDLEGRKKVLQDQMTHAPITAKEDTSGTGNPPIVGSGVDKFAEAMRKVREETKAAEEAQLAYNQSLTMGLPQGEAERFAKNISDTAKAISQFTKGLTADQAAIITPMVEKLKGLEQGLDATKAAAGRAQAIVATYGDGTKALTDATFYLDEALAKHLITQEQYNAALKDNTDKQQLQALASQKNAEGLVGLGAGFQYAALQMTQTQNSFAQGQELFTSSVNLMSSAISEFVKTGELDFAKLAESFADMVTKILIQEAILAAAKLFFKAIGGGGGADLSGIQWSAPAPALEGGFRAIGGPVTPGYAYTVGEQGPERFVPRVPGTIEPASGGGETNITMGDIVVTTKNGGSVDPDAAMAMGRKLKTAVMDVIANEKRPGGALYARVTA